MMTKEWKRLEKVGEGWILSTSPDLSRLIKQNLKNITFIMFTEQ